MGNRLLYLMLPTLLLILMTLATTPARAELGIALAPMRLEIQIPAGGQYTDSLRLSSEADEPMRARGELLDWYMDETMTPQFSDHLEQEKSLSCRDWLQVNPREVDLPARASTRVRYTLRVPAGTPEGEYHCGAGYTSLPPVKLDKTPMGMQIAVRAVAAFYVVVGNPASQPAFRDLSLQSGPEGTWEAVAKFENQGLRHYRIQGHLEVQDAAGRVVERIDYPNIPVLPKRVQIFPLRLKSQLAPGTYTLHSQADVGLPQLLVGSAKFVVNAAAKN